MIVYDCYIGVVRIAVSVDSGRLPGLKLYVSVLLFNQLFYTLGSLVVITTFSEGVVRRRSARSRYLPP